MDLLVLLAQEAGETDVQTWLQLATSTGFVGLAWYLIVVALPTMQKRFDEHSDNQMEAFTSEIERQNVNHQKQLEVILGHFKHGKEIDKP